jgi:hypothetical protein
MGIIDFAFFSFGSIGVGSRRSLVVDIKGDERPSDKNACPRICEWNSERDGEIKWNVQVFGGCCQTSISWGLFEFI